MSVTTKWLRPAQAAEKLGIGLSTLWTRARRDADFPKPIKLGTRTTVFVEHELDSYIQKRVAEMRGLIAA